ncbi:MAG: sigma 54-interacting transcriptional regulator [Magnetococcales bacterium]|nr:sigma 54-interacting transcriptional regulator [Magnetococcales bacterium]
METLKALHHFFDSLEEGVLFLDNNLRVVAINLAASKMLKQSFDEVVGNLCPTLFGDIECAKKCAKTKKCVLTPSKNQKMSTLQITIDRPGETQMFVKMWATRLPEIDGKTIFSVILRDCTREVLLEQETKERFRLGSMVGHSPVMRKMFNNIIRAAMSDATVLIQGESGTGKELAAKALHDNSSRVDGPYIRVHCASFPENLLESELFGYVKGAFTGAETSRMGRFEAAHGGTILLDEIGEISLTTQVKLLRVLQEREVERLGENKPRKIDVRVIAATNRDLAAMVKNRSFREDLYYRLNVLPLKTPALRDRDGDISILAQSLLEEMAEHYNRENLHLADDALNLLESHNWPGNVRELSNALEYALVHSTNNTILARHFPTELFIKQASTQPNISSYTNSSPPTADLNPNKKTIGYYQKPDGVSEKQMIEKVLKAVKGNKVQACKRLNMSRTTLWKRIVKYGL